LYFEARGQYVAIRFEILVSTCPALNDVLKISLSKEAPKSLLPNTSFLFVNKIFSICKSKRESSSETSS